jgi:hypothetical protein
MTKLGKSLTVKLHEKEVEEVNRWLIKFCQHIAVEHFIQNEGMTEEEAIRRVEPDGVFMTYNFFDDKSTISEIEIDVFVKEDHEVQQKSGSGTEEVQHPV